MHPKAAGFVLRTLPPSEVEQVSRGERERAARAYWDRLTPEQEAWALRKMRFADFGCRSDGSPASAQREFHSAELPQARITPPPSPTETTEAPHRQGFR